MNAAAHSSGRPPLTEHAESESEAPWAKSQPPNSLRNFGQYREIAQREPVAVTSHGRAMGYFVSAVEFEEMQRLKAFIRRSRAVADMTRDEIDQMTAGRMGTEQTISMHCSIRNRQPAYGAARFSAWASRLLQHPLAP